MRIGIQASTLSGRRTGINNYCYSMISALADIDASLEFLSANVFGWHRVAISEIASQSETEVAFAGANRAGFPQLVFDRLKKIEFARSLYEKSKELSLSRVYQKGGIRLFHAFNYVPPAEPSAPTLPVVYDLSFIRYPEMHPTERLRRLSTLGKYIERSQIVHTISEFSKREIMNVYGVRADKIFVAYPAAASHFRPLGRAITQHDINNFGLTLEKYFLAVGTLEPRKNLRTLIAAYANLSIADRARFPLVVVGGQGWGEMNLPAATNALVQEGSLRFVGFTSDAGLRSLYEGARLMLYPSVYEGFGMPVVEAMACGTPVAHSSETSMDEIAGDLAIRISALDIEAWTNCLRSAIHDNAAIAPIKRQNLVLRARCFDWVLGAREIRRAYGKIS